MAKQDPWEGIPEVRVRPAEPVAQPAAPVAQSAGDGPLDITGFSQDQLLGLRSGQQVRGADGSIYRLDGDPGINDETGQVSVRGVKVEAPEEPGGIEGPIPDDSAMPWGDVPEAQPLTPSQRGAEDAAAQRMGNINRSGQALYSGLMLGFNDEIGGLVAGGGQLASNAVRRATGQPIEINAYDLRSAVTNRIRQEGREFAEEKPAENFGLQLAGGALTGGGGIARGTIRGAVATGAGYGAGYGAGTAEGGFAERLPAAGAGAVVGGLTGGAIQGGANAAQPYVQRLAGIAGNVTRPAREALGRMGTARPEPEIVAARRFADQLERRGLSEDQIQQEIARRQAAGLNPTLLDVGGENVMATTRAVASAEGPARQVVSDYRDRVAAELGPRTVARARQLVDEPRDAMTMAQDITATRRTEARNQYGPAYEEVIIVPDEALRALRGDEGTAAMQQARRIASANQDFDTMEEIDRLLVADLDAAPVASGRALETIRRAYSDLAETAEGEYAIGLGNRLTQIDRALDEIPALRQARAAYRASSQQIDALGGELDRTGRQRVSRPDRRPQSAISATGPAYGEYVENLPITALVPNQVFQRDQIINQLSRAREGAVGPINALTPGANQPLGPNAPYVAQNLEATFPGQGQRFQQDIALAREQMTLANRVAPNEGSKTANVLQDQGAEGIGQVVSAGANVATGGAWGLARVGIDNLVRRGSMNEAEREAFARLSIGPAEDLQRVLNLARESRQAGRPPPREVRAYLVRTRNVLGAQSPVTQRLEQLLLPSSVAAEDQGQQ